MLTVSATSVSDPELVISADAVPTLSTTDVSDPELVISANAWLLLCKVDGIRSVAELASECGLTRHEANQVVMFLVRTGLLAVDGGAEQGSADQSDAVEEPAGGHLLAASSSTSAAARRLEDEVTSAAGRRLQDEVGASISRVSAALAAMFGPLPSAEELFAPRPRRHTAIADRPPSWPAFGELPVDPAVPAGTPAAPGTDHEAVVVHLDDVRPEADRRKDIGQARLGVEQARLAADVNLLLAEQAGLDAGGGRGPSAS